LDLPLLQMHKRQVAGRAAEHVGDNHNAVTKIDRCDRFGDFIATLFDVILRSDADRLHVALGPHDMLDGGQHFDRQPPMRDDDNSDHDFRLAKTARTISGFIAEKRAFMYRPNPPLRQNHLLSMPPPPTRFLPAWRLRTAVMSGPAAAEAL